MFGPFTIKAQSIPRSERATEGFRCCVFATSSARRPEIINTTIPGAKHYLHHGFDDPSEVYGSDEEKTMAFRRPGDDAKQWIIGNFADPKTVIS